LIVGRDGNVYGTARFGGAYGYGTLFEFTTNATLAPIAAFDNTNGAHPLSLFQANDGNFYGSTHDSPGFYPMLFEVTPAGILSSVYTFTFSSPGGPYPLTDIIQASNGLFYGACNANGNLLQISAPVAPVVRAAAGSPGNVNLAWSTVPGQTYQAQFNTNLTQTNWMNLGGPFTATNSSFTTSNPTSSNAQTFYRVVITP